MNMTITRCEHNVEIDHVNNMAYFAYDAVVVGATGMDRAIAAGNRPDNFTAVLQQLRLLEGAEGRVPDGATGHIYIDDKGDRIMQYEVVNLIGEEWQKVGTYDSAMGLEIGNLALGHNPTIMFPGGSTQIPSDRSEGHVALAALYLCTMCVAYYSLMQTSTCTRLCLVVPCLFSLFSSLVPDSTTLENDQDDFPGVIDLHWQFPPCERVLLPS